MKKNKCSYLIKTATINSMEDYHNLVKFYENDVNAPKSAPNNHIFDKDYTKQPVPEYYNSDDESSTDLVDKNKNKMNKSIVCKYCNKQYSRNDSLKRHYNTCKKKKEYDKKENESSELDEMEQKELIEQIKFLKQMMEQQKNEMEQKIKQLKESGVSSNISNISNINKQYNGEITENNIEKQQIIINNFGNENKEILKDKNYMLKWIDAPFTAIPHMVEKVHFSPDKRPENTNIRINNISNGKAQIYKYGKWRTIIKNDLIHELINECAFHLIEFYDDYVKKGLIKKSNVFEKFKKQYNKDDKNFYIEQKHHLDCKLDDLMKNHKTYLNSL
tara:strand:- start:329 stop:1321 length:993 start_codon:yes stop_codon:yes gene_type:complete